MTIEEKAKAYDETFERARGEYAEFKGMLPGDVLEDVFPELKESEDERIRKAIIKMIADTAGGFSFEKYGIIKKKALAWLEKQGSQNLANSAKTCKDEQKPAWSEEDEKAINDIMWIIEAYRKNGFNETHIQIADSSENWLKSLKERYTWKPSDEQIETLENVRKILHVNKEIYSKANNLMFNFEELIRTLKKL